MQDAESLCRSEAGNVELSDHDRAARHRLVHMLVVRFLIAGLLIGAPVSLFAQTATGPWIAGELAFSMESNDVVDGVLVGGQVGFRSPGGLIFLGEYLFAGTDYYYYTASDGWLLAPDWSSVPSGSSSRSDWLFYRQRHLVGLAAGLSGSILDVGLFAAGGFSLTLISLSEAADFYPEFAESASQSSLGARRVQVRPSVRAGVTWPAQSVIAGQLTWLVTVPPEAERRALEDRGWLRASSIITIGVVLHLGGSL
jgi:hypothetical protein